MLELIKIELITRSVYDSYIYALLYAYTYISTFGIVVENIGYQSNKVQQVHPGLVGLGVSQ